MDIECRKNKILLILFLIVAVSALCAPACADVSNATYLEEETAIPFAVWAVLFLAGMAFMVLAIFAAFSGGGGITILLGLISMMLLAAAAFAAPVTGTFDYITNSTTGATTPVVWLAFQPWMMWLVWGFATIAFLMFVLGILNLFKEQKAAEDMYWI